MSGQPAEVCQLATHANDPETKIQKPQQAEHTDTDPVRRDEHAGRPRIEGGANVIPKGGFHGVILPRSFSNTCRNASVTTRAACLKSGRSCAISGEIPTEGGMAS